MVAIMGRMGYLGARGCPACHTIVQNHATTQVKCNVPRCPGVKLRQEPDLSAPGVVKATIDKDDENIMCIERLIKEMLQKHVQGERGVAGSSLRRLKH